MSKYEAVETYYKKSYEECIRRVKFRAGGVENAEEVVQGAFTRSVEFFNSFDPSRHDFGAWFNTILLNELKDYQSRERMKGMSVPINEKDLEPVVKDHYSDATSEEISQLIAKKNCSPLRKEILRLYFDLEYTPRDIAVVINCNKKTVRQYVWEFREELAKPYG